MATRTRPDLGSKYQSGQKAPVKGNFVCVDCDMAGKNHVVNLNEGDEFPTCEGESATWRLQAYR